jgi:hypothetical protein
MSLRKRFPLEYMSWAHMLDRCRNKNHKWYHRYGGRGIGVSDRWSRSFAAFMEDMGPRPSPLHTIERVDNDGHYSAENCVWATRAEQGANTSQSQPITFNGKTLSVRGWAREIGIGLSTLRNRLQKMSTTQALTAPVQLDKRHWQSQRKESASV